MRKLLQRASFTSQAQLKAKILDFIDYFNRTMAKPCKWNYAGKPLTSSWLCLYMPSSTSFMTIWLYMMASWT
ncbi:MAG: hypothetical protein AAGG53_03785 [Cyanobacteria bacterium P01_H01_bin.152]